MSIVNAGPALACHATDVVTTKTASADSVAPGGQITYTITTTTEGSVGGCPSGFTMTDILPAGTTFVSLTGGFPIGGSCVTPAVGSNGTVTCTGGLADSGPNATAQFILTVAVAPDASGPITNTASVTGVNQIDTGDASASATVDVRPPCTISGSGNILGTAGNDVICGSAGPDSIAGLGGNDVIFAGGGDDRVSAGAGNDRVFGESGNDQLDGGSGNDTADGGSGFDRCSGFDSTTSCEQVG